jgi:small subunit ribosomal protein S2
MCSVNWKKKEFIMPNVSVKKLLEAGVHFGHHPRRWNPKMRPYIFGARNNVHIIDLDQTSTLFGKALSVLQKTVGKGGKVLFVGTKKQASGLIADAAMRSGQHYVNHRWLGGMLTNWKTVSNSIRLLSELEEKLADEATLTGLKKREVLQLQRRKDKLELSLGGIRDMGGLPSLIFVIDTNKESIAVAEAKTLGIPVIGVTDTNADPDNITYPVPGNDDASRSISLYCDMAVSAILKGAEEQIRSAGIDMGESDNPEMTVASEPVANEVVEASKPAKAEPKAEKAKVTEAKADAKPVKSEEAKPTEAKADAKPAKAESVKSEPKAEKAKVTEAKADAKETTK